MRAGISGISYLALLLKNAILVGTVFVFGGFAYHYWKEQIKKNAETQTPTLETRETGTDTNERSSTPPAPPPSLASTPGNSESVLGSAEEKIQRVSSNLFTHDLGGSREGLVNVHQGNPPQSPGLK